MTVLEHFEALCAIPHCSNDAGRMLEYLQTKASEYGYESRTDAAGNLLCSRADSKVTLQAHYDMVCIGSAPKIETVTEAGWMRAADSTLGADNGMGMAMMLSLMEEGTAVDCLFTADEEVGLVGARGLGLPLKTPYMLNLDSEAYGEITIGCAGGVDLNVTLPLQREARTLYGYEVVAEGYPGGHSGVDIDKNIPNAIKELAAAVYAAQAQMVDIRGGERRNAIAKRAVATVVSEREISDRRFRPLGRKTYRVMKNDVVRMLHGFAHGVRAFDTALGIVRTSVNLAEVQTGERTMTVRLSLRSMRESDLRRVESETAAYFEAFGATVQSEGFYAPWEPVRNDFVKRVGDIYAKVTENDVRIGAIHAGLECGIIGEKFPQLQMASVGPTILYPHSTRERVELQSVEKVFEVVTRLISAL